MLNYFEFLLFTLVKYLRACLQIYMDVNEIGNSIYLS